MNNKLVLAARLVLGLVFFVFGLNGFLQFLEMPAMGPGAQAFMGGLAQSQYFFPLLKGLEVIAGLMLLANMYAPLAVVLLAPIVVNIVLFHLFLAPDGMIMPVVLAVLLVYLIMAYKSNYSGVFEAKPE